MSNAKKLFTLILITILALNIKNVSIKVTASSELHENLFTNTGFDLNSSIFPFAWKRSKGIESADIQSSIGVDESNALKIVTRLNTRGTMEGSFSITPRSKYRITADACKVKETDTSIIIGVKNHSGSKNVKDNMEMSFDKSSYEKNSIDFHAGDNASIATVYFTCNTPTDRKRGEAYIDNFVIEETACPPTIDAILKPLSEVSEITGTAKPNALVEITLPNKSPESTTADEDGIYSLSIEPGTLSEGNLISAVQYGKYDIKSLATTILIPKTRLGKNLFPNEGFELSTDVSLFGPFYKVKSLEILEGIGYDSPRALKITSDGSICNAYLDFKGLHASSTYRMSFDLRANDSFPKKIISVGVRDYNTGKNCNATWVENGKIGFSNNTNVYQHGILDFITGDSNLLDSEDSNPVARTYYYLDSGSDSSIYLDNLVLEETSYPPTIDPVSDASFASITGTAEPGMKVKLTLPNNDEYIETVSDDGTYSIPIQQGSLKGGDTISAVQLGVYSNDPDPNPDDYIGKPDVIPPTMPGVSLATTITVSDDTAPAAPTIDIIRDTDKEIRGKSEPGSKVTIEFQGITLSAFAGLDSNYVIDIGDESLNAGDVVTATATDGSDNTSEASSRIVLNSSNVNTDEDGTISISGEDFIISLNDLITLTDEEILAKSKAEAFDFNNNIDITPNIMVLKDELKYTIGAYPITLSLDDIDKTINIYVVHDPKYTSDETKILTAKNFTMYINEINQLNKEYILTESEAIAWNIGNTNNINSQINVQIPSIENVGSYSATLSVNDLELEITIDVLSLENMNTNLEIEGIINTEKEMRNSSSLVTPKTTVILRNLYNNKEYIGLLPYDRNLIFKGIDYGLYEIYTINPSDILSETNASNNEFELTNTHDHDKITVNSEFMILKGFGNIEEIDTLNK